LEAEYPGWNTFIAFALRQGNLKGFTVIPRIPSEEAIILNLLFNNFPITNTAKNLFLS
jgi:hypothetical protein